jgi:hypothetical protein
MRLVWLKLNRKPWGWGPVLGVDVSAIVKGRRESRSGTMDHILGLAVWVGRLDVGSTLVE